MAFRLLKYITRLWDKILKGQPHSESYYQQFCPWFYIKVKQFGTRPYNLMIL